MEKKWTSNAEWPDTVSLNFDGTRVTTDNHGNKSAAQAVCDMLMNQGWGGEYKIFPIRTWVEEK